MRFKNGVFRSIAKWSLAVCVTATTWLTLDSQAFGHHPFRNHGCFGWGPRYHGGYSSYYSYRSIYAYPSFSFAYVPRFYSVSYYTPTYFAPVYYAPAYYVPGYYAPVYYPPACNLWGNANYSIIAPLASNTIPRYPALDSPMALENRVSSPLAMQTSSPLTRLVEKQVAQKTGPEVIGGMPVSTAKSVQLVSYKPALLQPYSPIWTKAAVGIVDEMVAAGEFEHAHSSCKSMDRIAQPKGAGVYLRQALLGYFSASPNEPKPSTEEVLNKLELACQSGSQVKPNELDKESLRSYFAACLVDVSRSMDKLSKTVLESPSGDSSRDLLLLSALLKLDGQQERARLFATEVQSQTPNGDSFQWRSLLNACLAETM